jgi:peptide/nickel transport system substrate-binding protein
MPRSLWRTMMALAVLIAAFSLAACGSDDDDGGNGGGTADGQEAGGENVTEELFAGSAADNRNDLETGERGGKITMLSAGDVDYLDPGKTYYTYSIGLVNGLHRGLYYYMPGNTEEPRPDLAQDMPEVSDDGRAVTVRIKEGVPFSAPVSRDVTSADVKYAIERAFTKNVVNGYAQAYFGDLQGAPEEPGEYKEIPGIETPDDQTIVFNLTEATGAGLAGALAMPITVPVPKEFAEEFDQEEPSTYGEEHAVYTGPYMVKGNDDGEVTGYSPGQRIEIVRNPDYENVDDFRPAFVDEWDVRAGNEDQAAATRRILGGESMVSGDMRPPSNQLQRLLESNKTELSAVPGGGWRMIALDTSEPPFDDINVRKAVVAGFNRNAARQQRGGEAIGPIAQHYIPPGMAGFEESNGADGWASEQDWMANPEGDRELSAEYFRRAGFESGQYEGNDSVLIVGDNADPDRSIAQIVEQQLTEMGFDVNLRLVTRDTMYTKFCGTRDSGVNVCPSVGWAQDFADPQTMFDPTFNGENVLETGNVNWPELDVPEINQAITQAKEEADPDARAQAWADVNKMVVDQAPAIPYMWDYSVGATSPNVRGVQNDYSTIWDLNFTSVEAGE